MPGDSHSPTLEERIAASDSLTPSETLVATYFARHRDELAFMSAADIAGELGVSDATVIRTAQTLDYAGLPDLKQDLREAVRARRTPASRYSGSLDELGDDIGALLDHVIADRIDVLQAARTTLSPEAFAGAVRLLTSADRILILGLGPLRHLAEHFVQSMRRFGRQAGALTGRTDELADRLMEVRSRDVLVVLAYERVLPEVDVALQVAADRHAGVILVTDNLALALDGRYAVALSASRGSPQTATTPVTPTVILEALALGMAASDRAATVAALERLRDIREQLDA